MEQCPEVAASWISQLFFCWLSPLFRKGNERPLIEADIFPLNPIMGSRRLTEGLEYHWKEQLKTRKPSLLKAILKQHVREILLFSFCFIIEGLLATTTTYLSTRVVSYFDQESSTTQVEAFMITGCCVAINLYLNITTSYFFYRVDRIGACMRIAVTGLVYRKACRLSQAEIADKSIGHIITLITNDAQRLDENFNVTSTFFSTPFMLPLAFFMLGEEIGYIPTAIAFATMIIAVPLQLLLGRAVAWLRVKTAPVTDERVKLINEVFTSMKVIKMYGWEMMFKEMIERVRAKEMSYIGLHLICKGLNIACMFSWGSVLTPMVTSAYMLNSGQVMTMTNTITLISIVLIVRFYLHMMLGHSFIVLAQFFQTVKRIQTFLFCDEVKCFGLFEENNVDEQYIKHNMCSSIEVLCHTDERKLTKTEASIYMSDVSISLGEMQFTLSNISLEILKGELVAIVGPVGCGKSSLLKAFLGELENESGFYKRPVNAAYVSQEAWIYDGTVEENILFNRPLDNETFERCIEACCLKEDLDQLPNGKYTLVGERGVQLSGGQRARISLARAAYGTEDIIFLDDPLSAVDSKSATHIFRDLIKGNIASRTRVLVTHATQFLSEVDKIIIMDLDIIDDFKNCRVGRVTHVGTFAELSAQGLHLTEEVFAPDMIKSRLVEQLTAETKITPKEETCQNKVTKVNEQKKAGSIDKRSYVRFISLGLGYIIFPFFLIFSVIPRALIVIQQEALLEWSRKLAAGEFEDEERYEQFETYVVWACGAVIVLVLQLTLSSLILNHSGKILHERALIATIRSPLGWFDNNPIGLLINRFTKDAYYMDEMFPAMFIEFLNIGVLYSVSLIFVAFASWWSIFGIVPLLILSVLVVRYYTTTSVEIKRIEAIKRSPLFSHVSHTLTGLTTIRASKQVTTYEDIHFRTRDEHTSAWMTNAIAERWLATRLDLLSGIVVAVGYLFCVGLGKSLSPVVAGLAIVYLQSSMIVFQYVIILATTVENLMTSIERIFEFAELPPEPPLYLPGDKQEGTQENDGNGLIEFKSVNMRYSSSGPYVLNNVTFDIRPGEKIGIVGRTGAGKSSLLQALFRMVESEGDIFVNGTLTRDMGLHKLRCSMSIIPQESLLFAESLRVNLDPFSEFSDNQIWEVLSDVELKQFVSSGREGIQMKIQEGGRNLSAGQRQLLCLARALLRNNKIIVIDEATASVDEKTDKLIQKTIREKFVNNTVLTIAHRINTVIDSDRIIVIDNGTIAEIDTPEALLAKVGGIFHCLAQESGNL